MTLQSWSSSKYNEHQALYSIHQRWLGEHLNSARAAQPTLSFQSDGHLLDLSSTNLSFAFIYPGNLCFIPPT